MSSILARERRLQRESHEHARDRLRVSTGNTCLDTEAAVKFLWALHVWTREQYPCITCYARVGHEHACASDARYGN